MLQEAIPPHSTATQGGFNREHAITLQSVGVQSIPASATTRRRIDGAACRREVARCAA
ncbi:hypothetical protein BDI4_170030 [Burkholderia diffusa]|nr:hypothetical protein BDI4_170030 [Burkholderia diffusa]